MGKTLTPKMLGLVDDVVLSTRFSNTRKCFKIVSERVIGYYVAGDGRQSAVHIAPIYHADIWVQDGKVRHVFSSHEIGDYLNQRRESDEEPDRDGDALAYIAMTSIAALETHSAVEAHRSGIKLESRKRKPATDQLAGWTKPKAKAKAKKVQK
jgi:hypothetical protein